MALGCDESVGSGRLRAIGPATIDLLAHTRPADEHVVPAGRGTARRSCGNSAPIPTFPDYSQAGSRRVHWALRLGVAFVPCRRSS